MRVDEAAVLAGCELAPRGPDGAGVAAAASRTAAGALDHVGRPAVMTGPLRPPVSPVALALAREPAPVALPARPARPGPAAPVPLAVL
ncbi:MAG: hypothetical protein AB1673_12280, partial [Actinomycetota bacterium]